MKIIQKTLNNGFVKHVFNFDNDTKYTLLNVTQYVVLAILPLTLYNYLINSFIPDYHEEKGNVEVLIEILGQIVIELFGLFFIHRLITYVPTYSGKAMGELNIFTIVLIYLVILYNSESRLGKKIKLLVERGVEIWEGKSENEKGEKKRKIILVVKVSQPISRGGMPTHQPSRADYLKSHDAMVSPTQMMPPANTMQQQGSGASNNMYNNGGFVEK